MISGEAKVDADPLARHGAWNPVPDRLTTQWFADGAADRADANGGTLDLTPDLVDHVITATVTAARVGYDPVTATTGATTAVAPGTFTVTRSPASQVQAEASARRSPSTRVPTSRATQTSRSSGCATASRSSTPRARRTVITALDLGGPDLRAGHRDPGGLRPTVLITPDTAPVRAAPSVRLSSAEKLNHRVRLTDHRRQRVRRRRHRHGRGPGRGGFRQDVDPASRRRPGQRRRPAEGSAGATGDLPGQSDAGAGDPHRLRVHAMTALPERQDDDRQPTGL